MDHVGRSLLEYIHEDNRQAVVDLMSKYYFLNLPNTLGNFCFRFRIQRNSVDSPLMRIEVAGLRNDDQIIPVEVRANSIFIHIYLTPIKARNESPTAFSGVETSVFFQ